MITWLNGIWLILRQNGSKTFGTNVLDVFLLQFSMSGRLCEN